MYALRFSRLMAVFATLLILTAFPSGVFGRADLPKESFWRQYLYDGETDTWSAKGIMLMVRDGDSVAVTPIRATYTDRGLRFPKDRLNGTIQPDGVSVRGNFGKKTDPKTGKPTGQDLILRFDLTFVGEALEGDISEGSQPLSRTRMARLTTDGQVLGAFALARRRWAVERNVSTGYISLLREEAAFLEKQIEEDQTVRGGRIRTLSTMTLDNAKNTIIAEEWRLKGCVEGERLAGELLTRLKAQLPKGTKVDVTEPVANPDVAETYWRQYLPDPKSGKWVPVGVMVCYQREQKVRFLPLVVTYTRDGLTHAKGTIKGTRTAQGVTMRGNFGKKKATDGISESDEDLIAEFRLKPEGEKKLVGKIYIDGKESGGTLLVRLNGTSELLKELEEAEDRWQVEKAVVMGTIPSFRNHIRQMETQEQGGQLSPMSGNLLDDSRRRLLVSELRLHVCILGIHTLRELRLKIQA